MTGDFQKTQVLERSVLAEIDGGLWHTTHPERFLNILEDGAILPEPNIPDRDRWAASGGSEFYPYVRSIGGVSLFNFSEFDPESYGERCPSSMWYTFVPYCKRWKGAVWIEVNRSAIVENFIAGPILLRKWKDEKAYKHRIMPEIEAAHIGPLPRAAFLRVFFVGANEKNLYDLNILNFDFSTYDKLLDGWRSRNAE
jgi:hypothetical protein